jgi:UDP-glucose 4-epimerase
MKIIVFGGSGFVGSHVADALTEAGHEVRIFDLRPSRFLQESQSFIQGDILNFENVQKAMQGMDIVYNFAGLADLNEAIARPFDTVQLNILGCVHLLEAARLSKVKRFLFASSIYVYSESGGYYRVSKQSCELYIEEFQRRHGLDFTILRFGTLYGRRADRTNSVFCYLQEALTERRISARGTGDEVREYIHVTDAARISVEILSDEYKNQNVVITGPQSMRYRDFLSMIREIVGQDVKIEFSPAKDNSFAHYTLTPYTFHPKIGRKLIARSYLDMGQGLLDCLEDIHASEKSSHS